MGIPERIAKITAGKSSDFGAKPSRLQQQVADRTHEAIDAAKSQKRKTLRLQKKQARESGKVFRHNPAPQAACSGTRTPGHAGSREEILGAMRGLDPTSTAYIMHKYAQDRSSYPEALRGLSMKAIDLHLERNWCRTQSGKHKAPDAGKDIIRSMVRLALFELNDPKCEKCNGTGLGKRGGTCRKCKGDRMMRISDKDRATALGVAYHQYRDTYGKRYEAVQRMIKGIGKAAIQQIHGNLYGRP